jgi:DNA-binding beta-propeller fold protein YncE
MRRSLAFVLLFSASLIAQQDPTSTELPGKPFFITKTWVIGGEGNWDCLTVDPKAGQLFIAHGTVVQVVDIETGAVMGKIDGLREAHSIALDNTGQFGYISDGPDNKVKVFDRHSLQVVASISTAPNPRIMVLDSLTQLLFVLSGALSAGTPTPSARGRNTSPIVRPVSPNDQKPATSLTVIDTQTHAALGQILFSGKLNFAQSDGQGQLYLSVADRNQVRRLDAQTSASLLRAQTQNDKTILDWRDQPQSTSEASGHLNTYNLAPDCTDPRGLAIDSRHLRLFVACGNNKLEVMNTENGNSIALLPVAAGVDFLGYDSGRGLIYAASGDGILTVIRQHVTDTYSVIQELPTYLQARTMAVNLVTGEVYLVTNMLGMDLSKPGGIGKLKAVPVTGSFRVLVVGN